MEFIILLLIIITNSIAITNILKIKIDLSIPITVILITVMVYCLGLFNILNIGVKIVEIISIISTIYNIIKIVKSIKNRDIKELLNKIVTPGLIVYLSLFLLFIMLNEGRIFEDYDEFNHWALIIKNMFINNRYGTEENSIITFNEYPPFTACFQYILLNIKGEYAEDLIIISQNILYISIIIPICAKINFDKKSKNLLFIIPAILILPLTLYEDFYINILVDGFLGILFAMGLFIIYKYNKEDTSIAYKNIILTLIITALSLTKNTGIVLAILLLIFIFIKIKKQKLKTILIILILPIILVSAWYLKVSMSSATREWDLTKITQTKNENQLENEIIIQKFFYAIFTQNDIIGKNLSLIGKLFLISIYCIYVYKKIESKENKKEYLHILSETIISFIIFALGLLLMYLTIFTKEEAQILASYDRYMGTILLSSIILNTLITCDENKINTTAIYIFIVVSIILLPHKTIYTKYIQNKKYISVSYIKRDFYCSKFKKYKVLFNNNDKLYFISNTNDNNAKILKLCQYETMVKNIVNSNPNFYGSKEYLEKALLEKDCKYLYLYKVEEDFKEKYRELFLEDIQEETLYKINKKENNKIELKAIY